MKINVNGYEVKITAKIGNIDATPYFLNYLSIALRNSSYYFKKKVIMCWPVMIKK